MAQYCAKCSEGKLNPVEMEEIGSGVSSTYYRCPMCQRTREMKSKWFGVTEVQNVSESDAKKGITKGTLAVGGVLLGLSILAAIAESNWIRANKGQKAWGPSYEANVGSASFTFAHLMNSIAGKLETGADR